MSCDQPSWGVSAFSHPCLGSCSGSERPRKKPPAPFRPMAEHKVLAEEAGTWDATVKTFMAGPSAPPTISKGTETNRLMTGGLWLLSDFSGDIGGEIARGA